MKTLFTILTFLYASTACYSQNDTIAAQDTNTYRIVKTDGSELVGKIISQNEREVLFVTKYTRQFYIPQHVIKEIIVLDNSDFNHNGEFVGEDKFATRYFITTNGLPIKKGEHYVQWNLFGPDFQFGLGKNFGVGVMTSWLGMPIIGTVKKSWELGERAQFAVGGLAGFGSWAAPDWGLALPFGTLSFGDRSANIAISGGYGAVWQDGDVNGRAITSLAGMVKVSPKISIVFDSFIMLPGKSIEHTEYYPDGSYTYTNRRPGFALLIPGIRWHQSENKAIQFGFSGVITDGEVIPVPIPMVQWYRTL
ncbi:MAG: hypothetical protein P8N52_03120 [Crocinitomicaceae bacterium]|nr:hypothetical protein [Crocinitomicaceae bacterium]MDG1776297.1 hypothetical protein [Crocinitomicaceae bacterium]